MRSIEAGLANATVDSRSELGAWIAGVGSMTRWPQELGKAEEIELTVRGRKSGKAICFPVWSILDRNQLYIVPIHGSRNQWFRNVVQQPRVTVHHGDRVWTATAKILRTRAWVNKIVAALRRKYGADQVKRFFSRFDVAVALRPMG